MHVVNVSLKHVDAGFNVTVVDFTSQVLNNFCAVIASIVSNNGGKLLQGLSVSMDGKSLLALDTLSELLNSERHSDL